MKTLILMIVSGLIAGAMAHAMIESENQTRQDLIRILASVN